MTLADEIATLPTAHRPYPQRTSNKPVQDDDERSMMAKAWGWGSQAISISLEMVVPGMLGLWVDRVVGTLPLFLILGVLFGMTAGIIHLVQFAQRIGEEETRSRRDGRDEDRR